MINDFAPPAFVPMEQGRATGGVDPVTVDPDGGNTGGGATTMAAANARTGLEGLCRIHGLYYSMCGEAKPGLGWACPV